MKPKLIDLEVHVDDRGALFEVVHNYDLPEERFGQCYTVESVAPFTVRAFHRHAVLWDYFCIVRGRAVFCLVGPNNETLRYTLDARKPQLFVVPPGWYHGWMNLVENTLLLSVGTELYNRERPDEERVPHDHFDELFIENFGRRPWEVWHR